jgi:hypothetical protein
LLSKRRRKTPGIWVGCTLSTHKNKSTFVDDRRLYSHRHRFKYILYILINHIHYIWINIRHPLKRKSPHPLISPLKKPILAIRSRWAFNLLYKAAVNKAKMDANSSNRRLSVLAGQIVAPRATAGVDDASTPQVRESRARQKKNPPANPCREKGGV